MAGTSPALPCSLAPPTDATVVSPERAVPPASPGQPGSGAALRFVWVKGKDRATIMVTILLLPSAHSRQSTVQHSGFLVSGVM